MKVPTLVTLADACARLPELIELVAKGDHVLIVENGVTLAALGPPPFDYPELTPEQEAERLAKAMEGLRQYAQWCVEDGVVLAPDDPLRAFLDPETPAA
jgi:antitoxin (DNA-binding transcriptional repressor) of toxin-antitoxin stability system